MPSPTDRGYVVVIQNADGTRAVRVAADIADGGPVGVYAEHVGTFPLVVDPGVMLVESDAGTFSRDVVQVSSDDGGVVHIDRADIAMLS